MNIRLHHEHLLRLLFPPAAAWALLLLFAEEIDGLRGLNPFPESATLHSPTEGVLAWLPVAIMLAAGAWTVYRWPAFLRLPLSVSPAAVAMRLITHGLSWCALVFLGIIAAGYLVHDPSRDAPEQRYLGVWLAGFMYTPAVAPLATLFTVWLRLRGKDGDTG